jgi:hypothetical protein
MLFFLPTIQDRATCSNYPPMQGENEEDYEGNECEKDTSIHTPVNTVLYSQQWKNKNAM